MTHPRHGHLARLVAERLRSRAVVVWYDPRSEFRAFLDELGPETSGSAPADVVVGGLATRLVRYRGTIPSRPAGEAFRDARAALR